jgi:RHH-type proline utilization regulon transcriptional repressor/proline dehydrogenase/delta 1-pyrroline-5-carboxylate dehydrogenase
MAYLVRRLLENTSNESWLMHRHEEGDPAILLRAPVPGVEAAAVLGPAAGGPRGAIVTFRNVSPLQFHLPEVRGRMQAALAAAHGRFGRTVYPIVAGKEVRGGDQLEVRSPASPATVVGRVGQADEALAHVAIDAARDAFEGWKEIPVQERARCLRAAADLLEERRYDLAALEVFEVAKPWREADGDVCEAVDYLRYYAAEAERLAHGRALPSPAGEQNEYRYEPRGVAAIISPWNFPLAILAGMTSAAVAAGCTAVVKPAEQSPLIAAQFVEVLHEAGLPPGVVNYLPGHGETVGAALVRDPRVSLVAFTGSQAVGLQIARAVAEVVPGQRELKRAILEMGGKNAIVVDEDADLDEAVAGVVASAFGFAGQKCSACSRVIVVGQAAAPFRDRLAAAVESLVVGPPDDPYTFVPPVISAEAKRRIEEYAALGEREGRLLARAGIPGGEGHYVAPTVFEGVSHGSRLAREEIFGPILLLFEAASFGDALDRALDIPFALTGGVYSRHPGHIAEARRRFRVGNLYINRRTTGAIAGRQPFGGLGLSGSGDKAGGPDYLLNFLAPRTITENTMRRGFAAGGSPPRPFTP